MAIFLLLCLSFLSSVSAFAQADMPVSGTVRDDKGAPVEFASVRVAGTQFGTTTDAQGLFKLNAPSSGRLIFTSVGFDTVELAVQSVLNVTLTASSGTLSDVVVIGYGTARKVNLTGSVATVTAKDFQQGAITTPEQLISGKIAGVSITSNGGSPGSGSVIRIRGGASLNASNDPLIVIDGVPLSGNNIYGASNSLSLINPNDIESFTVLKDAASTAIYGSRASNGVILITTRKGKRGKPVVNFSTQASVATLQKKIDVQSADQFRQYVSSFPDTYDGTHPFSDLLGSANTDWQDEIYKNAVGTDNNISVSGSIKNVPYRVAIGYLNQDGILRTDNLQRSSGAISLSPKFFKDHLKVDINLKGSLSHARFANGAAITSAVYFDPTQPVYDASSQYGGYYEWGQYDAATSSFVLNKLAPRNPVALLDMYHNTSNVQRSFGNIQFDYSFHFLPELHANVNLGYDVAKGDGRTTVPADAAQNYLEQGQNNPYSNSIDNKVFEGYLNYNKTLKAIKSNVNATAGYGYYNNKSRNDLYASYRANGEELPGTAPLFAFDRPENTLLSYYARLIYTYNEKYIIAASYRTDGSSKFARGNRWGKFPSVAATWRINSEEFLKSSTTVSDLKLRLSYGVTGNQDGIANYSYLANYATSGNGSQVQFGNNYYYLGTPAAYDSKLKWEQTESYNAGIDYGFLRNRITGSLDVYFKKTKDLLNVVTIPAGSNFSTTLLTNVGNVENKGIEFQINAAVIQKKDLTWDLGFNATYNENKVTNLTLVNDPSYQGTVVNTVQIQTVGYPLYGYYVYHQQYDKAGHPIEGVFVDVNGDGQINQADLYHYKSPYAKFIFGFSTGVTYKKWSLSTVLRANLGNYVYNGIYTGAIKANVLNPLQYLANSVNDIYNTHWVQSNAQSDYYIENASFLKMDNLGLAYNVGSIINNKVKMRVSANCQNVFTVTNYKGIDPEIYNGYDGAIYPRPRTFVLGVNLQF